MAEPTTELRNLAAIPGFSDKPSIDPDSDAALDAALKAKEKDKTNPAPDPAPALEPEPDPAPAPVPDPKPGEEPPKPDPAPAPAPAPAPSDDLESVPLPPYSKPKTGEAFEKVKSIAREKISGLEKERDALKKERDEIAAKLGDGVPKELEDELKELRSFRNKMDVEANPEFKTFDKTISDNIESIYSRLKADNFSDEQIEQIKKLGGPSEVDWDSLANKMKPGLKRFIDSKLVENETLADRKARAISDAKKNAEEYLRTRQEEQTDSVAKQNAEVKTKVEEIIPKLGWLEERKPKDGATEAEKVIVEKHNKLVKESNEFLQQAAGDSSAEFRGLLAVGYVQLLKAREDIVRLKSDTDSEIKQLKSDLKEKTDLLEKVKKSSTARLQSTPAPDNIPNPSTDNISTPGAQALDNLMKERFAAK